MLYLMLGYPGAGKTTVAKLISEITDSAHLWADHERAERFVNPTFSQAENDELYSSMNQEAAELLKAGKSVVFDTAFNHYADRQRLRTIAVGAGADTVIVWVKTPRELAETRAVEADGSSETRKLDHHMTHGDFHRLSDKLEEPRDGEKVIEINGTKVTEAYVRQKLQTHETPAAD